LSTVAKRQDPVGRVHARVLLPCGHYLERAVVLINPGGADYVVLMDEAARALAPWLESRAERHDCALVDDDNPNGLPKAH